MGWLYESGHAIDIVLAVIAAEFAWLAIRRRWHPTDALLRLAPGVLMLLALRGALTDQSWIWVMLPLTASFPVHLADLLRDRQSRP